MARYTDFLFTIFKDVELDFKFEHPNIRYYTYQWETCPTSRRTHMQGYMQLHKQWRLNKIKTEILNDNSAHIEKRFGSVEQCITYCNKDETRLLDGVTYGIPSKQGKRNDINKFAEDIGKYKDLEMVEKYPNELAKYIRFYDKVKEWKSKEKAMKFRKLEVFLYWGEPGTGKTRAVYDAENYDDVYPLSTNGKDKLWFNGYEGNDVLLLDDFYGNCGISFLLRLLDGYPLMLETKGGVVWANYTKVYITSNVHYEFWYKKMFDLHPVIKSALIRRFTLVKHFDAI